MKIGILLVILSWPIMAACTRLNPQSPGTSPVEHTALDLLLKKYVDKNGMVNYQGIKKEETQLDEYLKYIQKNGPNDKTWSKEDQLVYWINAYNAFTIRLILNYYPVESIKDIGSKIPIPYVNTAWDIKFINIGATELSLNNIEHNIIRKNFNEPRIHFALVCAAKSCPKLRNEAYKAGQLDRQLTDQARVFLADQSKNQISTTELKLSNIFNWYGGDFTKTGTLIDFLNQYAPVKIGNNAKKSYLDYDWSLNEQ